MLRFLSDMACMIAQIGLARLHEKIEREKYLELFNATQDAILIFDPEGKEIVDVNDGMLQQSGYRKDEIPHINLETLSLGVHPYTMAEAKKKIAAAFDAGPQRFDWHCKRKDGKLFWTEVHLKKVNFGSKMYVVATARDISDRKLAEEKFRTIFEQSGEGMSLANADGRYVSVNQAFCKMTGYNQTELLTMTPFDLTYHRDEKPWLFRQALGGKMGQRETKLQRKDGSLFDSEVTAYPIQQGEEKLALGIVRDISKRKLAEEELCRYQHIISASSDPMAFIDQNLIHETVNKAYLHAHQRRRQDIIGHSVEEVFTANVYEKVIKENLRQCLAGENVHYQDWFHLPGMGHCYLDVNYYPHRDNNGQVKGIVVTTRNITDIKKAEIACQDSNTALKVLVDQQRNTQQELEQQILTKLKNLVFPYLELLQSSAKNSVEEQTVAIVKSHLSSVTDSFTRKLTDPLLKLSPREILVADLVRQGRSTEKIADMLRLSQRTVEAYRMQLRKKLGLSEKKENLCRYLLDNFVKE